MGAREWVTPGMQVISLRRGAMVQVDDIGNGAPGFCFEMSQACVKGGHG
jgi:hypothetical protein